MILPVLTWWIASALLGLLAFPLAWRLFSRLPDRGFGFSRALGLMISGYALWMGASTGVLNNNIGGSLGAVLLLGGLGYAAGAGRWGEIWEWVRQHRSTLLSMEGLFIGAFVLWSFVRANNPEIAATEKPMELAFLNAIMRSSTFPPADPWLSGYAISYYYFGYVLLALMTRLTGVATGVAFNVGNALWFALVALGSYSILYNLLTERDGKPSFGKALLGPLFVLVTGNLEGFLEILHGRHVFWQGSAAEGFTSSFWSWLDLEQLSLPPAAAPIWRPDRYMWWWRASRVVRDYDLQGNPLGIQPIDEFPFFSFLLADNHPHLLALPFVLMAVGFALQVFLAGDRRAFRWGTLPLRDVEWRRVIGWLALVLGIYALVRVALGVTPEMMLGDSIMLALRSLVMGVLIIAALALLALLHWGGLPSSLTRSEFWFSAWLFGGLALLNTWDFPIYLSLLVAAVWWNRSENGIRLLGRPLATFLSLVIAAVLLYLPWYPTFTSQAGGILPNLAFATRLPHFIIMFGTALVPIVAWLIWRLWVDRTVGEGRRLLWLSLGIPLVLFLLSSAVAALAYFKLRADPTLLNTALAALGAPDLGTGVNLALNRRLTGSWTALLLGFVIAACVVLMMRRHAEQSRGNDTNERSPLPVFVLFLIVVGGLLTIGVEFFYLRDFFNVRMNTIFKFYFAGWILWGLAAAYLATELRPRGWGSILGAGLLIVLGPEVLGWFEQTEGPGGLILAAYAAAWIVWIVYTLGPTIIGPSGTKDWRAGALALLFLPLALGLVYTIESTLTKTSDFNPPDGRTLDGNAYLARHAPHDEAAIRWIVENQLEGTIAEAVGGSYTDYARVSTHTGLSTVLGWEFHEVQWRGGGETQGSRAEDIRRLYSSRSAAETLMIVDQYDIAYVYIGPLERSTYGQIREEKFESFMERIYTNQEVTIFARSGMAR